MVTALVMHVDVARELKVPFAVVTALVMHVDVAREGYYTSACFSGMYVGFIMYYIHTCRFL